MPVLSRCSTPSPPAGTLGVLAVWAGTDTGYASNRARCSSAAAAGLPFQFQTWAETSRSATTRRSRRRQRTGRHPAGTSGRRRTTAPSRTGSATASPTSASWPPWSPSCSPGRRPRRPARRRGGLPTLPPWHVQENKWRAARYGPRPSHRRRGNRERLVTDDLEDVLTRLERSGSGSVRGGAARGRRHPQRGASYQRQRRVAEDSAGDLVAVVTSVVDELHASLAR